MPIHEYKCLKGHITERFFPTFRQAEEEREQPVTCEQCGEQAAYQEFSTPCPAHLYGNPEGYYKPSPTKRYSTKLVSQLEGNSSAVG